MRPSCGGPGSHRGRGASRGRRGRGPRRGSRDGRWSPRGRERPALPGSCPRPGRRGASCRPSSGCSRRRRPRRSRPRGRRQPAVACPWRRPDGCKEERAQPAAANVKPSPRSVDSRGLPLHRRRLRNGRPGCPAGVQPPAHRRGASRGVDRAKRKVSVGAPRPLQEHRAGQVRVSLLRPTGWPRDEVASHLRRSHAPHPRPRRRERHALSLKVAWRSVSSGSTPEGSSCSLPATGASSIRAVS